MKSGAVRNLESVTLYTAITLIALFASAALGMFWSYPAAVPVWTLPLLGFVLFGSCACCGLAVLSLFLSRRRIRAFSLLTLALLLLSAAGFLRNGDPQEMSSRSQHR
jgi:hypothetical protein